MPYQRAKLPNGVFLNVRVPTPEAAALSRALQRKGLKSLEQNVLCDEGTAEDLLRYAQRVGVACTPELAQHALDEWRACTAAALEAHPKLKAVLEDDHARAESNGDMQRAREAVL